MDFTKKIEPIFEQDQLKAFGPAWDWADLKALDQLAQFNHQEKMQIKAQTAEHLLNLSDQALLNLIVQSGQTKVDRISPVVNQWFILAQTWQSAQKSLTASQRTALINTTLFRFFEEKL